MLDNIILTDLAAGTAGEHLVCADLIINGYKAFLSDQTCPYDIAVDLGDKLIKLQVKTTREAKPIPQRVNHRKGYMWHVRRAGKGGNRVYSDGEFDVLALVALDCRKIAYMEPSVAKNTIQIRSHEDSSYPEHGGKSGRTFSMFPFSEIVKKFDSDMFVAPPEKAEQGGFEL